MEEVPTDKKDRPVKAITIIKTEILVDPASDAKELEEKRIKELAEEKRRKEVARAGSGKKSTTVTINNNNNNSMEKKQGEIASMIGKYLPKNKIQENTTTGQDDIATSSNGTDLSLPPVITNKQKVPPPTKTKFGDFSGW